MKKVTKGMDPRIGKEALIELVHLEPLTGQEDRWLSELQGKAAEQEGSLGSLGKIIPLQTVFRVYFAGIKHFEKTLEITFDNCNQHHVRTVISMVFNAWICWRKSQI